MIVMSDKLGFLLHGLDRRKMLPFIGDKLYVSLDYRLRTGKRLNLKNPVSFNEKLQWLKVYDHNPRYGELVDKILAKKKVGKIIGEQHIVPMYGMWNSTKDINWEKLPQQFVLKCNHDQGSVVIVSDKDNLDIQETNNFIENHLSHNNYYGTREYAYKNIRPMVFAEKFLGGSICDYKFYCFNGMPRFLYVGRGLTVDHSLKIDFFDMDWNNMPFYRTDYQRLGNIPKPKHFDEMQTIAKALAKGTKFVRIDLFEENDQVYFSEFTLCPASGYMPFEPEEYDEIIGSWLKL